MLYFILYHSLPARHFSSEKSLKLNSFKIIHQCLNLIVLVTYLEAKLLYERVCPSVIQSLIAFLFALYNPNEGFITFFVQHKCYFF